MTPIPEWGSFTGNGILLNEGVIWMQFIAYRQFKSNSHSAQLIEWPQIRITPIHWVGLIWIGVIREWTQVCVVHSRDGQYHFSETNTNTNTSDEPKVNTNTNTNTWQLPKFNTNTNTNTWRIRYSIPIPIPILAKTPIPQYQYQYLLLILLHSLQRTAQITSNMKKEAQLQLCLQG